jgi:hypothetical protein
MDAVSLVILFVFVGSMYLVGRMAEQRGRRFKTWAGVACVIGPLAFPLLFLFPNRHTGKGDHA